jgi:hypothetical protein
MKADWFIEMSLCNLGSSLLARIFKIIFAKL